MAQPLVQVLIQFLINILIQAKRIFNFHDLCRTAATRMAGAVADAFNLMRILGLSDNSDNCLLRARKGRDTVGKLDENADFGYVLATKQKRQAQGSP